jgi:hypothetical protein
MIPATAILMAKIMGKIASFGMAMPTVLAAPQAKSPGTATPSRQATFLA